jgi:superfamily II DNA or RNA helicase
MSEIQLSKPGTLINARGREWVVLPDSSEDLLMVRPVGGMDEEITGILPEVEHVQSAVFSLPTIQDVGDFRSGRLLRDAARISTRAAAGPFRSFGRIAVEPRPYQLVPLMMALKLDPVRLLIADDVGIGKTIEAAVIARELLDRGEIKRLTVLCPPHLAEQWQKELAEKFHIDAELILSSTIRRLERNLRRDESVFEHHRFTIVSTDFIKNPRHSADFIRRCPEFVIVDEAHSCTLSGGVGRGRQQRFELVHELSKDPNRHLVLVTATPHSGNEQAFHSLLGLLDKEFFDLPLDLEKSERDGIRRKLAQHLVQRRRKDIEHYLETDTNFPIRRDLQPEPTYKFTSEYRQLFDDIVDFARAFVSGPEGGKRHQRVRYWSALALLRCVSSSPAAAVATLRSRAAVDEADDDEIEDIGRRTVLDQDDVDDVSAMDFNPGSGTKESGDNTRRKLLEFARRAEKLYGNKDNKLHGAVREIKSLLKEGFSPIVFCRFIDTAEYVANQLRDALPNKVRVESVTGNLPPANRKGRIADLTTEEGQYVLVSTDCLAEGINLQNEFDAVFHYDLAWNPTRHEQREGRVDRFGQKRKEVRVVTYYGFDNPVDGVILDVLIRKHKRIKNELGVAIAVPESSEQIAQTLFEGALFRKKALGTADQMDFGFPDVGKAKKETLHRAWENALEKEKASRSRFAQHAIDPKIVEEELFQIRDSIGRNDEVALFLKEVLYASNVHFIEQEKSITIHLNDGVPRSLRQALGQDVEFKGRFDLPLQDHEIYLGRTSPTIEGLAGWTLDQALDPIGQDQKPVAFRTGLTITDSVSQRTTLLLARFRYHLKQSQADENAILCEEIVPLAFTGMVDNPVWIEDDKSQILLNATPVQNLTQTLTDQQIALLIETLPVIRLQLDMVAGERAQQQLEAHTRVRKALRAGGQTLIEPVLPVDILGAYVLLPRRN